MKSGLSLIFAALVVLLGAMVWVVRDRQTAAPALASAVAPEIDAAPLASVEVAPTASQAAPTTPAVQAAPATTAPAAVAISSVAPLAPSGESSSAVHVSTLEEAKYVARTGDTVSQLAIALLGSDSKEHRDVVIASNPSLKSNPDLVLAGQMYLIAPASLQATDADRDQHSSAISRVAAAAVSFEDETASVKPVSAERAAASVDAPKLKYAAQVGDTVRVLAANLLGGDTHANREAIIAENPSLQQNPDHLVAGRSYTITAPNGLAVDPNAPQPTVPTSQPDSDDVLRMGMARTLRYTAQPGDTVSKLATVLIGSDTSANRDLIIKSNPSLMQDSHQLIAGRTYWITAPSAE